MKYEEYREKIDKIIASPDTAMAEIEGVYDALREDLTTRDSLAEEVAGLKTRVQDLQATNVKLFMSRGEDPGEEKEDEGKDEDEEAVEAFFAEVLGEDKED